MFSIVKYMKVIYFNLIFFFPVLWKTLFLFYFFKKLHLKKVTKNLVSKFFKGQISLKEKKNLLFDIFYEMFCY